MSLTQFLVAVGILLDAVGAVMVYRYASDPENREPFEKYDYINTRKIEIYEMIEESKQRRLRRIGFVILLVGFVFQAVPVLIDVVS